MKPLSSKYVAKYGIDGMLKGKKLIVPGFLNKCMHIASKLAPNSISMSIIYKNQTKKVS